MDAPPALRERSVQTVRHFRLNARAWSVVCLIDSTPVTSASDVVRSVCGSAKEDHVVHRDPTTPIDIRGGERNGEAHLGPI